MATIQKHNGKDDDLIYYNGEAYAAPNAAWTSAAPSEWRETPERLEQSWTMGYGGKGWKTAMDNYDSLAPVEQAVLNNVNAKYANGGNGSSSFSSSYSGGQYEDSYAGQIKSLTDQIMNRGAFSYDVNKDPLYAQYADQYTRLGQRAMDDTLAKVSARTGGLASSYATTAGNQAYQNYMQELSNKVPELYKLAYDMYADQYNRDVNNLNLLRGLSSDEYNRYANERSYADSRSDLAYQRAWNEENRDYTRGKEADANKVYAYGDGEPYEIGTGKGQSFVLNSVPGDTMTGGDGSRWENVNGQIVITRDGKTWAIGTQAPATPVYYYGGGEDITKEDKTPKSLMSSDELERGILNYMQLSSISGMDPYNAAYDYVETLINQGLVNDDKTTEDVLVKILGGK